MKISYTNRAFSTLLLIALLLSIILPAAIAQEKTEKTLLTPQNMFAAGFFPQVPRGFTWLPDESAFFFNQGRDTVKYDVATGEITPFLDMAAINKGLMEGRKNQQQQGMGNTNATGRFNRSGIQVSPDSKMIMGLLNNDLYVYDFVTKKAKFITNDSLPEQFQVFSPDSKKVAFLREHDIYMVDLASGTETRLTDNGGNEELWNGVADWVYEEELAVRRAFWWAPTSDKIAYLQFNTTPIKYFTIVDHLNLWTDPEMQKFAMAGAENSIVKLGIVNLENKATVWADTGKDTDVYIYQCDWNHSGSEVSYRWMNRAQTRLELRFANSTTGASRTALVEERDTWVNARVTWLEGTENMVFLSDDSFIWSSDKSGYFHLYHHDKSGKLLKQLTDGPWQVENIYALSKDEKSVFFRATESSPLERNVYSVNLDGSNFKRLTVDPGDNASTVSPFGNFFISNNSSINTLPKVRLFNKEGEMLKLLGEGNMKGLDAYQFHHTKLVELKAEDDGTPLYGAITLPPDFDPNKKYPVIVYVYGGPAVQMIKNSWNLGIIFTHQNWASQGYIAFTLDNRGTWGRGHDFEKVIHKNMGDFELRDQVTGVKYLKSLPYVDGENIGITGGSYGGYMTLHALFRAPEHFKAGVSKYPATDWRHYDTANTERYMGKPQDNAAAYDKAATSTHSKGLKGHLYLIHGMMDNNVHVQQAFDQIEALLKAGKDFKLMLYPRERHGIGAPHRRGHMAATEKEFFKTHLQGGK